GGCPRSRRSGAGRPRNGSAGGVHPLRSLSGHLRFHDRDWGHHHPSATISAPGGGNSRIGPAFVRAPAVPDRWQLPAARAPSLRKVAMVYVFPRLTKVVPASLVALVTLTAVSFALKFDVPVIGEIPSGFPKVLLPSFDLRAVPAMVVPAFELALLGAIDSLL